MANVKVAYGTNNQTITITLASLTTTSSRASTAIDNTSNNFLDALVMVKAKSGASSTTSTGYLSVYAYGTVNGGTNYTDAATGTDAAITLPVPPNAILIGIVTMVANATTYVSTMMSVASAFNGSLPDHWGIIVTNNSGGTLDATGGSHVVIYQGVYATVL